MKMKWHDATKMLPPMGATVLVRDGDNEFKYMLCRLFGNEYELCFMPYVKGYDCIEIKDGVVWTRIKLPKE